MASNVVIHVQCQQKIPVSALPCSELCGVQVHEYLVKCPDSGFDLSKREKGSITRATQTLIQVKSATPTTIELCC